MIMMWSGTIATIPSGWVLCNGSNSTPDLRNRFVIGAHTDSAGVAYSTVTGSNTQTGGTKDAAVVSHTHTATVSDPGHSHTLTNLAVYSDTVSGGGITIQTRTNSNNTTATATTGITVSNSTEGSSGTNQNLPPYYALAFIMKT
jgi:microcystin-dependent protein